MEPQKRNLLIAAVILAVLLIISLIVNFSFSSRNNQLNDEKIALQVEVRSNLDQIEGLNVEKSGLEADLAGLEAELEALKEAHAEEIRQRDIRISRLGRTAAEVEELRKKLADYEALKERHGELEGQYAELLARWDETTTELELLSQKHQELQDEVAAAMRLKAYNINTLTKWDRWLWPDRYNIFRARRVNQTFVNFEINGSRFVPHGDHQVHLIMKNPQGDVMYPAAEIFYPAHASDGAYFTKAREVSYAGEPVQLHFTINHPERLEAGQYVVEVYINEELARTTTLALD